MNRRRIVIEVQVIEFHQNHYIAEAGCPDSAGDPIIMTRSGWSIGNAVEAAIDALMSSVRYTLSKDVGEELPDTSGDVVAVTSNGGNI